MTEPNYEQVDCDQPLPEGRIRELAEGKANPWPIDSQILAREVLALRAKLAECVGNPLAGNPAEWGHADQIAGLGAQLITTRAKLAEVENTYGAMLASREESLRDVYAALAEAVADTRRLDWLQLNAAQISIEHDSWIADPEGEETPLRVWLDAAMAPTPKEVAE